MQSSRNKHIQVKFAMNGSIGIHVSSINRSAVASPTTTFRGYVAEPAIVCLLRHIHQQSHAKSPHSLLFLIDLQSHTTIQLLSWSAKGFYKVISLRAMRSNHQCRDISKFLTLIVWQAGWNQIESQKADSPRSPIVEGLAYLTSVFESGSKVKLPDC